MAKEKINKDTTLNLENVRSPIFKRTSWSIESWKDEFIKDKPFQYTLDAAIQLDRESLKNLYWYLKASIFNEDGELRKYFNQDKNYLHTLLFLAHIEEYGIDGAIYPQRNKEWADSYYYRSQQNMKSENKTKPLLQSVQDAIGDVWNDYEVKSYGYTTQEIFDITHDNPELLEDLMESDERKTNKRSLFYIPVGHFGTHNIVPPDDVRIDKKFDDYAEFLHTTLQDTHRELEDWKKYYNTKIAKINKQIEKNNADYRELGKNVDKMSSVIDPLEKIQNIASKLQEEKKKYTDKLSIIYKALSMTEPLSRRKIDRSDWYTPDINFIIKHHIALNNVANTLTKKENLDTLLKEVKGFEVAKIVFFVALFSGIATVPTAAIGAVLSLHSYFTKGSLNFFKPASQKLAVKGEKLRKEIPSLSAETVEKFSEEKARPSKRRESKRGTKTIPVDIISNLSESEITIDVDQYKEKRNSIIESDYDIPEGYTDFLDKSGPKK